MPFWLFLAYPKRHYRVLFVLVPRDVALMYLHATRDPLFQETGEPFPHNCPQSCWIWVACVSSILQQEKDMSKHEVPLLAAFCLLESGKRALGSKCIFGCFLPTRKSKNRVKPLRWCLDCFSCRNLVLKAARFGLPLFARKNGNKEQDSNLAIT